MIWRDDHDFHVVVEAGGGQSTEIFKSANVFPDGGGEILCLYKPHVLAARVSQQITEGVHPAPAFSGEGNVVR